jgi:hypothetical protein
MTMTTKRQPAIGEIWTIQSCMVHCAPIPVGDKDWKKEPVNLVVSISKIDPQHVQLVECGCMEFGKVDARLHGAPAPKAAPAPATEKPKA